MDTTARVAAFISGTGFREIPREGLEAAKRAFLDTLGVMLAGSDSPPSRIVIDLVKGESCQPRASVVGAGFKTSSTYAALINGISAHFLDYDDTNALVHGHPSTVLVPAVLAFGEEQGVSGADALVAYVVGLEVAAKVGRGTGKGYAETGWHFTATLGTLGAAAAGAKILNLDVETTRVALGIAASLAGGSKQNFGTMTKSLHAGNAARNGIQAAVLAKKGFTADKNILEGKFGFCKLFSKEYDLEMIIETLGSPLAVVDPGINVKPYPSCRRTHSAVDAVMDLMAGHDDLRPEHVDHVEVRVLPDTPLVAIHSNPGSGLEGKFSVEFCVAMALLRRRVGLGEFTDEVVLNSETQDMMQRITMVTDPVLDEGRDSIKGEYLPSVVTIQLRNGKKYSEKVDFPRGHGLAPLSREQLLNKYRDVAGHVLSDDEVNRSVDLIEHMDELKELSSLAAILRAER